MGKQIKNLSPLAQKVLQNELDRLKNNHRGGRKKGCKDLKPKRRVKKVEI